MPKSTRIPLKKLFKKLEKTLVEPNGSKYLSCDLSHKKYIWMRDRQPDTSYYLITLKGNYIRGYKINYINSENKSINVFMNLTIPSICGDVPIAPVRKKILIAKQKFKDYLMFIQEFKKNSETLSWYGDEENE